jgi:hypothetical protein
MVRLKGWLFVLEKKCIRKKEKWGRGRGGEEEGRSPGHKLNITDEFTDIVILLGILSVILSVKNITSPYDLPC